MMFEYPFGQVSDLKIRPLLDGDKALAQQGALLRILAGGPK